MSEIEQSAAELFTIEHIFGRKIFDLGPNTRIDLRGAWIELHETCRGHGRSSPSYEFVSDVRYHAAFSNAFRSNSSDVEKDAKTHFLTPCKIRGGVDEISGSRIVASPTTEPQVYI